MMGITKPNIHPSVVVDETHGPVEIHPLATVGPNCVLIGPVRIDRDVHLSSGVIVGSDGESYSMASNYGTPIVIEGGSRLREHVVVQRGLCGDTQTRIGRDCYVMHGSHIAHDCRLEDSVTLAPYVVLGGHTYVMTRANLGIQSSTHQWVTVGSLAMVGMGAVCIRDVPPATTVAGVPARPIGENTVGMERAGWDERRVAEEAERWAGMGRKP